MADLVGRKKWSLRPEGAESRDFLALKGIGSWTDQTNLEVLDEMARLVAEAGAGRVLVDCTEMKSVDSTLTGEFHAAEHAVTLFRPLSCRIAVLVTEEELEASSFFQTAVRNRGIAVEHFVSEREARAWLLGWNGAEEIACSLDGTASNGSPLPAKR